MNNMAGKGSDFIKDLGNDIPEVLVMRRHLQRGVDDKTPFVKAVGEHFFKGGIKVPLQCV